MDAVKFYQFNSFSFFGPSRLHSSRKFPTVLISSPAHNEIYEISLSIRKYADYEFDSFAPNWIYYHDAEYFVKQIAGFINQKHFKQHEVS